MVTEEYKFLKKNINIRYFQEETTFLLFVLQRKLSTECAMIYWKVIKEQNWGALENFGFEGNKWWQKNTKFLKKKINIRYFQEETTFCLFLSQRKLSTVCAMIYWR